ncbi:MULTISPECIES: hypothetical protein [unclassified Paraburkholderia]|uniref:hypothetical protein n=1 Tax=unclassified Paraburkholderia TaxID=2615204 RepID=UPI001F0414F8|nr:MULTISPECIES: hypothetical protein [unclassified Paraburkholderia]
MSPDITQNRQATKRWYQEITSAQWRVLVAAWGDGVNDALDFPAITFVLKDVANTFNVALSTASLLLPRPMACAG